MDLYIFLFFLICSAFTVTVAVVFNACGNESMVAICECTEKIRRVDCTNRGLYEWPDGIPINTVYLYMADNKLREINQDALLGLTNLRNVNFNNNLLKRLPKFPQTITHISAERNFITDISAVFNDLPMLANLLLSYNNITTLRNSTFKGTTSLYLLRLMDNHIRIIEPYTFMNTSLNTIYINNNNELEELPENSFALSGVRSTCMLFLGSNKNLKRLFNGTFRFIYTGSKILLNRNNFQRIPAGAFQGGRIEAINLDFNNISFIDEKAFTGLKGLNMLSIIGNHLTEVPIAVYSLKLEVLDLSWNHLESLGDRQLPTVRDIVINKNNIRHISRNNFGNMTKLELLMLIHNNITSIEEGAFRGTNLRSLFLYGNGLTNVTYETLNVNKRTLKNVYIFDNGLERIEKNALTHMATNGSVYLDCDRLRTLPSAIGDNVDTYCVTEETEIDIDIEYYLLKMIGTTTGLTCNQKTKKCNPCKEGTYKIFGSDIHVCFQCPPGGFYQDRRGIIERGDYTKSCIKCPIGSFSGDAGAASIADCQTCPSGTKTNQIANLNACYCLQNFHRTDRYGACWPCPKGVNCDGGYQKIEKGYWWSWKFSGDCGVSAAGKRPCLKAYQEFVDKLENDNFPNINPNILKNAVYTGPLPEVHVCLLEASCEGGVTDDCSKGYSGWLCAACAEYYYELFNECRECKGTGITVLILIGVTVAVVGVIYLIWRLQQNDGDQQENRIDSLVTHLKIAINFYQVLGILSEVTEIHWPTQFELVGQSLQYLDVIRYVNMLSPRCFMFKSWNAYSSLHVAIATPVAIVVSVSIFYFIRYIWNKYHGVTTDNRIRHKCLFISMMLLYLTYANTCADVMAVGPWSIRSFNVTADGKVKKRILTSDYSIDLDLNGGLIYQTNKKLVYGALTYVIGFPLAVVLMLYFKQRNGEHPEDNERAAGMIGMKFFCGQYKRKFWFWEVFELYNKAILALIANFRDDVSSSMSYSLFFTVIFIVLHLYLEPMKAKSEQRFQLLTLVFIVVNLSVGAIVDIDQSDEDRTRITPIILLLLNISILLSVIVELFKKVKNEMKCGACNNQTELIDPAVSDASHIDNDEQGEQLLIQQR